MRLNYLFVGVMVVVSSACHSAALNPGARQVGVGGTIAGTVTTTDGTIAIPGRKVTATETTTGLRYEATTATNGGYTIKVPKGRYGIEVELRTGEVLAKHPDPTQVNEGDLDPGRDFVITVKPV